jgi:outer membrane protein TolC
MAAAREGLYAADLTHNSMVQSVVLQAEGAYFGYQAARGLHEASLLTVTTAQTNLAAAERRHDVGLATIADVLQARTALAQARLASQSAEGTEQAARAQLAYAVGLPANSRFVVVTDTGATPIAALAEDVDSLIARAVAARPDVMAARATARQSLQQVRQVQSAMLPALSLGANRGQSYSNNSNLVGGTYSLTFAVTVPLFNGLSRESDVAAARENAAVAAARADQAELTTAAQVWTSYWALQTATERVTTAGELLASATQSEEVARGRYAEGVGSILDLLTAQNALADARAQSIQSRWTWFAALAQLARDAGVLGTRGENNLTLKPAAPGSNR